jgi:hypothetical protein
MDGDEQQPIEAEVLSSSIPKDADEPVDLGKIKKGRRTHNWDLVKDHYIQGVPDEQTGKRMWLNMRELSEIHEVPYNKLRERKSKEGWDNDRSMYQVQHSRLQSAERNAHLVSEVVDFDAKVLAGSKVGVILIQARLGEIAEQLKYDRQIKASGDVESYNSISSDWVDSGEIAQLSRALSSFQDIGRKCLGDAIDDLPVASAEGDPNSIDVREELAYAPDERIARTLEVLSEAGLIPAGESEGGSDEATDAEAPGG